MRAGCRGPDMRAGGRGPDMRAGGRGPDNPKTHESINFLRQDLIKVRHTILYLLCYKILNLLADDM